MKEIARECNVTVNKELAPWGLYLLTFPASRQVGTVVQQLQAHPSILYAEPNYQLPAFDQSVSSRGAAAVSGQAAASGTTVAVLDIGFDLKHPYFWKRLHVNQGEIPGDGFDNDGNGYVDDFQGYDFYERDPDPLGEGEFKARGMEAVGRVISGSREAEISLLPLRVGNGPWLSTATLCEAIVYAVGQGANIVNLNLGGWWKSQSLIDTVGYAAQQQVILIASAGQESSQWLKAMSNFPQVVWVAAVEEKNWRAGFFSSASKRLKHLRLPDRSSVAPPRRHRNRLRDHHTVTCAPGKIGLAAQFQRERAQYLWLPDSPDLSMGDIDFTIAAWVYLDSKDEMIFLSKGDSSRNSTNEYLLRYLPGEDHFQFAVGNGFDGRTIPMEGIGPVATGSWYFIVAWHDTRGPNRNTIHIQVNDQPIDPKGLELPPGVSSYDSTYDLRIGYYSNFDSNQGFMNGRIDEVAVWKRVLSPQERTDLFNRGQGNPYLPARRAFSVDTQGALADGLVVIYPFEEEKSLWDFG